MNFVFFKNLTEDEINTAIQIMRADKVYYKKDEYIFHQMDIPQYMYILLEGKLVVERLDISGKATIMNIFSKSGTIFAEVFLFLSQKNFEYSARAITDISVLRIPKDFLKNLRNSSKIYDIIIKNLLEILAQKAYHLNQKIAIHSSFSLRQKIANYIFQIAAGSKFVDLGFNREQLAGYIGTTRPSLSRELMNMAKDGLIKVNGSTIEILNQDALENLL